MRPIITILLLAMIMTPVYGVDQGRIHGNVSDNKKALPLCAVNVYLDSTHIGTITDNAGNYLITDIPAGDYHLVVEMIGYERIRSERFTLTPGESVAFDFRLTPETIKFRDAVIVTATRGPSLISEVPASVNVIDAEHLEILNPQNMAEALQSIQGVFIKDYGGVGNQKTISLRGSTSGQVLVMLDGQRLNNPQTGQVDFSAISVEGIERIEVVRGGNSALYGADAVGGVINIITKKGSEDSGWQGSTKLTGGSFYTGSLEQTTNYVKGNVNISGSYKYLHSDGDYAYTDQYGAKKIKQNGDVSSNDLFLKLGRSFGDPHYRRQLDISYKRYSSQRGMPGTSDAPYLHARMWDKSNQLNGILSGKIINLMNDLRLQGYHHSSWNRYRNDEGVYPIDSKFDTDSYGIEAQIHSVLNHRVVLTYGAGVRYDWLEDRQVATVHERFTDYLFLLNETKFEFPGQHGFQSLAFVPSVRYDRTTEFGERISPKIGGVLNIGKEWKTALKVNSGASYRAPTFNDLYWPEDNWTKGNPDLKPEQGFDWDTGIRMQYPLLNGVLAEVSYFENTMDDLILWQDEAGFWQPENVQKSRINGVESSLTLSPIDQFLVFSGNYTYLNARNLSPEKNEYRKYLIYRPRHTLNLSLSSQYSILAVIYQLNYVGRRYVTKDNSLFLGPYLTSDLIISLKPEFEAADLSFSLQVKNLWDERYEVIRFQPVPGREFRLSLGVSF